MLAAGSNISAVAPDVPPVISSPFTNGPFVDGLSNDRVTLSPRVIEVPSTKGSIVILVCDITSVTVILDGSLKVRIVSSDKLT